MLSSRLRTRRSSCPPPASRLASRRPTADSPCAAALLLLVPRAGDGGDGGGADGGGGGGAAAAGDAPPENFARLRRANFFRAPAARGQASRLPSGVVHFVRFAVDDVDVPTKKIVEIFFIAWIDRSRWASRTVKPL